MNVLALDTDTDIAASQNTATIECDSISKLDITTVIAGNNPSNQTFVDGDVTVGTDQIAITSHGFLTGMKITELTTTGTLPTGLSLSTVYYVIKVDDDTIQLATSQANAVAGTQVDITAASGGGTHTISVATSLAGSVKLQKCNTPDDNTESEVWFDMIDGEIQGAATASQSFSAAGNLNWSVPDFGAHKIRAVVTVTSGTVTARTRIHGKS